MALKVRNRLVESVKKKGKKWLSTQQCDPWFQTTKSLHSLNNSLHPALWMKQLA